jgi:TM2 domain-containing membrane protein YozV
MSSAFCGLPRKFAATVPLAIFVVNGWRGNRGLRRSYLPPNRLVDCASAHKITDMAGQGSAGNVLAALCSFFIPGLGQLLQGRLVMAIVQFCLAAILWFVLLGWIIHLWSILDAALFKPGK